VSFLLQPLWFWLATWIVSVVLVLMFVAGTSLRERDADCAFREGWERDDRPLATVIAFPTPASRGLWLDEDDLPEFHPIVNGVENGWVS
jgi:hypothetical protein